MVEKLALIDKKEIKYSGIFSVNDLYTLIDDLTKKNGYIKKEYNNRETIKKDGRSVNIRFEIRRKMSDYATSVIQMKILLDNIKDLDIEKEGTHMNRNQGDVRIIFDAYLENDFEHKWENTPGFFFVRVLFDKYIFKPFTTDYQGIVMKDYNMFKDEITAFLNLNKY